LRGVDLDVGRGEVLAIMGPSGSGKSTLLHVMAGVFPPDEGVVDYEGTNIADLNEVERSRLRLRSFGFVFQFGQLLPDLSAVDNVTIPLLLSGWSRKKALARARDALAELGLADHGEKRPGELSGGQAQRVAVARALISEPAVLFADEPTGSLDTLAAEKTMDSLLELVRSRRRTMVIVTHDPRIASYADREVIVRDGVVSFRGGDGHAG
jgi:ABC-type antimicrobial peptide transport system, ATPase component